MTKDEFTDLFMDLLKNKDTVIENLFQDLSQVMKHEKGMAKFKDDILTCDEQELRRKLSVTCKVIEKQSIIFKRMCIILMTYTSGGNFDIDAAKVLNKCGRGQEALQHMLKQKLKKG